MIALVLLAAAVFYGYQFGKVYWHRYRIRDVVDQQLSYLGELTPESIQQQLSQKLAKMHVPAGARRVNVVHTAPRSIRLTIAYKERVNLLYATKEVPVSIQVSRTY
jgi:hypothetical protein